MMKIKITPIEFQDLDSFWEENYLNRPKPQYDFVVPDPDELYRPTQSVGLFSLIYILCDYGNSSEISSLEEIIEMVDLLKIQLSRQSWGKFQLSEIVVVGPYSLDPGDIHLDWRDLFVSSILLNFDPSSYYEDREEIVLRCVDLAIGQSQKNDIANYDFWVVSVPNIFEDEDVVDMVVGMGHIGRNGVWISGEDCLSTLLHELGHNLGLFHSQSIQTAQGGPGLSFGDFTMIQEYGDPFSVMGQRGEELDFNLWEKEQLGWVQEGIQVQVVSPRTSGHFTLTTGDHVWSENALLGVRTLWREEISSIYIGFETRGGNAAVEFRNGALLAYVYFGDEYGSVNSTQILFAQDWDGDDCLVSCPLQIGSVYTDRNANPVLTLKPIEFRCSMSENCPGPNCPSPCELDVYLHRGWPLPDCLPPCQNGGECIAEWGPSCSCPVGTSGRSCEKRFSPSSEETTEGLCHHHPHQAVSPVLPVFMPNLFSASSVFFEKNY